MQVLRYRPVDGSLGAVPQGSRLAEDVKLTRHLGKKAARAPARWHCMVVFSNSVVLDAAAASAVVALYRTAFQVEGGPAEALLYERKMGNHHIFYFSPAAARICTRIFEVFPAEPCEEPTNLQVYSPVQTESPHQGRTTHFRWMITSSSP
jgi:hypothetical protein